MAIQTVTADATIDMKVSMSLMLKLLMACQMNTAIENKVLVLMLIIVISYIDLTILIYVG